jgi:hypothetical protein
MTKDEMKKALVEGVCTVVFDKRDGTERTMECTLDPKVLPMPVASDEEINRNRAPNEEVQVVWDVKSNGWRSFRIDSVKEFTA